MGPQGDLGVYCERGIRNWTEIGFSSTYYLIGKLRDRGLVAEVDSAESPQRRPAKARKVFTATSAARRVLRHTDHKGLTTKD
jgi:DNA-binding PadR family transcriptional regulator